MDTLGANLLAMDDDHSFGCVAVTYNQKAFAAGVDLTAIQTRSYIKAVCGNFINRNWETLLRIRKLVIAAVGGYALVVSL